MRVLYFSSNYSPHDHRFLTAIVDGGHAAFFLQLESTLRRTEDRPVPPQVEQVLWAGGRNQFRWWHLAWLTSSLKDVIRRLQPDLIHAGPIQTCALLVTLAGFQPLLTMSWGFDLMQDFSRGAWTNLATRFALRHSTFFTSDAEVTRDRAVAYGMNPERTCVIPWGVDLTQFRPGSRPLNSGPSFTILCNRAWEPRYGVDVLARAFVLVARQSEHVGLILLGGGSQAHALRTILRDGNVQERVSFGGQISQADLPRWYQKTDLYVSPSHVDGASVSLMEALASGLPVVVSDIPGNKEWVQDDINGWLFPDGDEHALAAKILDAIGQRERFPEVGREGRKCAEQRADWSRNAAALMHLYETARRLN